MPVLGSSGRVLLKRPTPAPCEIHPEDFNPGCNAFSFNCPGYWPGDQICVDQLPIIIDGFPVNPAGYASYQGSKWFVGPNRTQISGEKDKFYKNDTEDYPDGKYGDDANFYCKKGVGGVPEENGEGCYWIHIDQFGRLRFYDDRCSAIAGCPGTSIELGNSALLEPIEIITAGEVDYQNAHWECLYDECFYTAGDYTFSDVQDEETDVSICASAPEFDFPVASTFEYQNADVQPRPVYSWPTAQALCGLRSYTLNLDAPAIDTTLVGEKFGENIKSLVNGGGSFEFFIDRNCLGEDTEDASWMLMNLLFLTEGGGCGGPLETEAWFYLFDNDPCAGSCFPPNQGALYYKANILITQTAVNVRPTEMIVGTAEFVTTGDIRLLQSP